MKLYKPLVVGSLSLIINFPILGAAHAERLQIQSTQIIRQSRIQRAKPAAVCLIKNGEYLVGWLRGASKASKRVVDTFKAAHLISRLDFLENRLATTGGRRMGILRRSEYRFLKRNITKIVEFENQCSANEEAPLAPTTIDPKNGVGFKDLLGTNGGEGGVDSLVVTVEGTRSSCVAPCAVFAKASSPTVLGGERDASHLINFDATNIDPTNPHNIERQRAAAHIYTVPGTYQIVAAVQGAFGDSGTSAPVTVTVQDPNVVYHPASGGRTICATTTANPGFANCPSYAQQVVSDSLWTVFQTYLAPISSTQAQVPTRIMLKEGSVWTSDALWWASPGVSQALITSFPNPANPVRPKFISNNQYQYSDIFIVKGTNVTIENIQIQGNFTPQAQSFSHSVGFGINDSDNVLLRNVKIVGTGAEAIVLGGNSVHTVVADSEIRDVSGYGFFAASNWTAIIRNTLRNTYAQMHMLRVQDVDNNPDNLIISKNDFGYDTLLPENNMSLTCITVRGFTDGATVTGNKCERVMTFRPQDDFLAEIVNDVIVDGNIVKPAATNTSYGWVGFQCLASGVTFRNNLILNIGTGISVPNTNQYIQHCTGAIYNNTYINSSNELGAEHIFLNSAVSLSPQFVFNNIYQSASNNPSGRVIKYPASSLPSLISAFNIYYAPQQASNWTMFERLGATSASYTLGQWQSLGVLEVGTQSVDPQINPTTYIPMTGSPAIDRGVSISAFDAMGAFRPRDGNGDGFRWQDIGAMER